MKLLSSFFDPASPSKGCKAFVLLVLALLAFSFSSCSSDEEAKKYTVFITVNYPTGYTQTLASGVEVKALNAQTGTTTNVTTDANGLAEFSLISGVYKFTIASETEEFAFNGILENTTIAKDQSLTIDLSASTLSGGLVIKEIYYVGSLTASGGYYYSDQFVEIYNNSDDTIYLDKLILSMIDPITSNSISSWADTSGVLQEKLPLYGFTFYVPGTGTEYPLLPRTSAVIAQDGIDHKSDAAGNANSPVNLGSASWETYVGDLNGGKDADAAAVPNLSVLYATSTSSYDFIMSVFGPAVIIAKLPDDVSLTAFTSDDSNFATKPGTTSSVKYLQIPRSYVIDAVECVNSDVAKQNKRIPSTLDAGYVYTLNTYTSKSLRRKVKQIIDGNVIYKDTNNSTQDFLLEQTPAPFVHSSVVEE
ncbi:MAG: hypothetical protein H6Q14_930 [Bacteroidetes bacterium]|nr:hypothetical protein [Bacteroidota bacterium]